MVIPGFLIKKDLCKSKPNTVLKRDVVLKTRGGLLAIYSAYVQTR